MEFAKSLEEMVLDPNKFGAPTFEQFAKNREQYIGRDDDQFSRVDKGSHILKKYVQRHRYEFHGYHCETLEEVERVAGSEGYAVGDLMFWPEIIPDVGLKCSVLVHFVTKAEMSKIQIDNALRKRPRD